MVRVDAGGGWRHRDWFAQRVNHVADLGDTEVQQRIPRPFQLHADGKHVANFGQRERRQRRVEERRQIQRYLGTVRHRLHVCITAAQGQPVEQVHATVVAEKVRGERRKDRRRRQGLLPQCGRRAQDFAAGKRDIDVQGLFEVDVQRVGHVGGHRVQSVVELQCFGIGLKHRAPHTGRLQQRLPHG